MNSADIYTTVRELVINTQFVEQTTRQGALDYLQSKFRIGKHTIHNVLHRGHCPKRLSLSRVRAASLHIESRIILRAISHMKEGSQDEALQNHISMCEGHLAEMHKEIEEINNGHTNKRR